VKGVVFNILEDMVTEKGGLMVWQKVLEKAGVGGGYTAVATYSDDELFAIVGAVVEELQLPAETVVSAFGTYMFGQLAKRYPMFVDSCDDLFSFLESIDSVIHLEVKKLMTETHLPSISCTRESDNALVMDYRSPRKLCLLAEGLIYGAAAHYDRQIKIEHPVCMHKGSDHCDLRVQITDE
jgi:predicted hydrocarbon binding protein